MDKDPIDLLKEYAKQEAEGINFGDDYKRIKEDGYRIYTNSKDIILFRRGTIKDPKIQLTDPLSEVTRKERRLLLSISLLTLIIIKVGLFPTRITAFGVDFHANNISSLFNLLGFVLIYLLIIFIVYGFLDIKKWSLNAIQEGKNVLKYKVLEYKDIEQLKDIVEAIANLDKLEMELEYYKNTSKPFFYGEKIRIVVEIAFPIIFSICVIYYAFTFDSKIIEASFNSNTIKVTSQCQNVDTLKNENNNK